MVRVVVNKKKLTEADVSSTENIAAISTFEKNHQVIILIDNSNFNQSNPEKNIIGAIKLAKASSMGDGECNKAYNITSSVVAPKYRNKGYAKLLYKLAASSVNSPIIPDRFETSEDAEKVWNSFSASGEFKIQPLKNCTMVDKKNLNKSFSLKNAATYKSMLDTFVSRISLDEKQIKNISLIATKMFPI